MYLEFPDNSFANTPYIDLDVSGQTIAEPIPQETVYLWLDDTLLAQDTFDVTSETQNMTLSIDHPYDDEDGKYADQSVIYPLKLGGVYSIISDFGRSDFGKLLERRQTKLQEYRNAGKSGTSREILTESLNIMGQNWMRETALMRKMMIEISGGLELSHHRFGVMAQEEGYYIDVKAQFSDITSIFNLYSADDLIRGISLLASAMEHGMLEQMQGKDNPGASTIKLLKVANQAGQKIYRMSPANKNTVISQLSNYSTGDIQNFQNLIENDLVVLPKNANVTLNQWTGKSFIHVEDHGVTNAISMTIGGDYLGGYAGIPDDVDYVELIQAEQPNLLQNASIGESFALDPVSLVSGAYTYNNVDLQVGHAEPRGLRFQRFYRSNQNSIKGDLGYGWTHNYNIEIHTNSAFNVGFGLQTPADCAVLTVASAVILDLLKNEDSAKGWLAASLTAQWAMDNLTEHVRTVQWGDKSLAFTKLPDGSYCPPAGSTATLVENANGTYTLKERFGIEIKFNANNKAETWKDADGNTLSFHYNTPDQLGYVQDAYNRRLIFSYRPSDGLLGAVYDNSIFRSISFGYENENLTSYYDPEGNEWNYTYYNDHLMKSPIDPLEQPAVVNYYDTFGVVTGQVSAIGQPYALYFSDFRNVEEDPEGNQTVYFFDRKSRQTSVETPVNQVHSVYDGQNHMIFTVDANTNFTWRQYDGNHNLTNVIDALGGVTKMEYDNQHHLRKIIDPLERETEFLYDNEHHNTDIIHPLGYTIKKQPYSNGLVEKHIEYVDGVARTTKYFYDEYGNPERIEYPDTGVVTNIWNARGDLLSAFDALSNPTHFTYDDRRLQTSVKDGEENIVSNIYNEAGQLVTVIDPEENATHYAYTPSFKINAITYPDTGVVKHLYDTRDNLEYIVDPLQHTNRIEYDNANRQIATTDAEGNRFKFILDANGNVLSELNPNPFNNPTTNTYDALNRLVSQTDRNGFTAYFSYDKVGNLRFITNALDQVVEHQYNDLNQRIKTIREDGKEEDFQYDQAGNLKIFTNAKDQVFRFTFDKMNRLRTRTNPLLKTYEATYYKNGNIHERKNPENTTTYFYDKANRLTYVDHPTSADVSYFLDKNGNVTNAVSDKTISIKYDSMNRMEEVSTPHSDTIKYKYSLVGNLEELTYPNGKYVKYEYYKNNHLSRLNMWDWAGKFIDYSDRAKAGIYYYHRHYYSGNYGTSTFFVDKEKRVTSYTHSPPAGTFIDRKIERNALGYKNREFINKGFEPSIITQPALYNRTPNSADQIEQFNGQSITYSNNGNLDQSPWHDFMYDEDNRFIGEMKNVEGIFFAHARGYDALDGRINLTVMKAHENVNVAYTLDYASPLKHILKESIDVSYTGSDGNPANKTETYYYVWGQNGLAARITEAGNVQYYHGDELGNILAITSANSGETLAQYFYLPYGDYVASPGSVYNPFTYSGAHGVYESSALLRENYSPWDVTDYAPHGKLYMMGARHYHSYYKTFLSKDKIGIHGQIAVGEYIHAYLYGRGSPNNYVDPTGQWALIDDAIAIVAGAALGVAAQGVSDLFMGEGLSDWEDYVGAAVGGAAAGEALLYTGPVGAGAAGGATSSATKQWLKMFTGKQSGFSYTELAVDTGTGALFGKIPGRKILGVTKGRGSHLAVANQVITKIQRKQIKNISTKTAAKIVSGKFTQKAALEGAMGMGMADGLFGGIVDEARIGVFEEEHIYTPSYQTGNPNK